MMKQSGKGRIVVFVVVLLLCATAAAGLYRGIFFPRSEPAPAADEGTEARAEAILADMTTEEKVGQLFLADLPAEADPQVLQPFHFGGYVIYADSFKNREQWLSAEEFAAKLAALEEGLPIPPFFAVDEEGGSVVRLTANPNLAPDGPAASPQQVWKVGGKEALREDTLKKSELLRENGIHINIGPVADVVTDIDAYMYDRSLGADAETTAGLVEVMVAAAKESGIGTVLKHFPGYGNNGDTHGTGVVDERPYEQLAAEDFLPFKAGIAAGADAVMMSHTTVTAIDPQRPASLAPEAYRLLREELNFDGVIITDDLRMNALAAESEYTVAVDALKAGCDMMISSLPEEGYRSVQRAIAAGELEEKRIDESVKRILCWKLRLGVLR